MRRNKHCNGITIHKEFIFFYSVVFSLQVIGITILLAAHVLARCAKHCNDTDIWLETVPPDIGEVTHQEFLNIQ